MANRHLHADLRWLQGRLKMVQFIFKQWKIKFLDDVNINTSQGFVLMSVVPNWSLDWPKLANVNLV